ncbi:glycosyltransferase family 39 protein [Candidatus Sumerlaeota bacterium]|nr:glycosyltransferase family 39 protein [Candidatus Sumerlaeota bacterium]
MESAIPSPITPRERMAIIVILILAAVLRLALITDHGLKNNDFISIRSATQLGWWGMIEERTERNHMPLYFLTLKSWLTVAGTSEASLRLPSVAFGLAGVALLWWVGRMLFGPAVGLLAALLALGGQQWLETGFDVRMYSMLMALALLAIGCAWRWFETGERRWAWAHAITLIVGLHVHLLMLTVPLSLLGAWWFSWRRSDERRPAAVIAVLLAPALAILPMLIWWSLVQYKIGHAEWSFRTPGILHRSLLKIAFGDYDNMPSGTWTDVMKAVGYPTLALSAVALLGWRLRGCWQGEPLDDRRRRALTVLLWVLLMPLLLVYVASFKSGGMKSVRYVSVACAVTPLLLAAAWWGLRWRWMRVLGLALVVTAVTMNSLLFFNSEGDGIRESMVYLREETEPGHVAITCAATNTWEAFGFYGVEMPVTHLSRELDDPGQIREIAARALGDEGTRIYLYLFHPDNDEARDTLHRETPWLERVDRLRFGESQVWVFERVDPQRDPS